MTETGIGLSFGRSTQVILIGTANYSADPMLEDIPQVRSNLDALLSLFLDPAIVGISARSITSIFNEEHASELLNKVNSKAAEALDTLFIYYAGHGLYGDEDSPLYLAAQNTTDAGKSFNGVDYNKLKRIVGSSPAKQKIVVLDCCYSGSVLEGGLSGGISTEVADITGTFVMTASAANKRALAPPDHQHTLFTGILIDILENGRDSFSSAISLGEIYGEIDRTLKKSGKGPTPERSNWKDAEDFRIAFNQFGRERGTQQALAILQVLEASVEQLKDQNSSVSKKTQSLEHQNHAFDRKLDDALANAKVVQDGLKEEISALRDELESASVLIWLYKLRFVFLAFFGLIAVLVIGLWIGNS